MCLGGPGGGLGGPGGGFGGIGSGKAATTTREATTRTTETTIRTIETDSGTKKYRLSIKGCKHFSDYRAIISQKKSLRVSFSVFSHLAQGFGNFRARIQVLHVEKLPGHTSSCLEAWNVACIRSNESTPYEFGIGILIIGANLYGGVYKLQILIREKLEEFSRIFHRFFALALHPTRWIDYLKLYLNSKKKVFAEFSGFSSSFSGVFPSTSCQNTSKMTPK